MYSITLVEPGALPVKKRDLILFPAPPNSSLAFNRLPKSTAFPVAAIVTYSITSISDGVFPPAKIPRVELPEAPNLNLPPVKSPKSILFPVVGILNKSIWFDSL